ncbi:hypothetical protein PWG71_03265 [Nocardiopsis sp. N85]|uniref:hypothetical protein n=1 Tax=Nocardiopsis sp. N85 TaxID=3029400 RepID=UPI00237F9B61|nr:hypothetical protein [Nocardiopsis sp. N85]MDE3720392.1 hypothetical protein [Nocardiopsis sp. N85]
MTRHHDDPEQEETAPAGGGLYVGGSITGGAVVTGARGRAEDRSRTEGAVAPLPPVTARPVSAPPGQAVIAGHITGGALVTGEDGVAVNASVRVDAVTVQVLDDLAGVRAALGRRPRTFEVEAVDDALARAEEEITDTGEVGPGLLRRLLALVRGGSAVVGEMARTTRAVEDLHSSLCVIEGRHGG